MFVFSVTVHYIAAWHITDQFTADLLGQCKIPSKIFGSTWLLL